MSVHVLISCFCYFSIYSFILKMYIVSMTCMACAVENILPRNCVVSWIIDTRVWGSETKLKFSNRSKRNNSNSNSVIVNVISMHNSYGGSLLQFLSQNFIAKFWDSFQSQCLHSCGIQLEVLVNNMDGLNFALPVCQFLPHTLVDLLFIDLCSISQRMPNL